MCYAPKNENASDELHLIYSIVLYFILNDIFFSDYTKMTEISLKEFYLLFIIYLYYT